MPRRPRVGRSRLAATLDSLPVPLDTPPMEAELVDALPAGAGWQYEPKWDGFRCLAFVAGDGVALRSKSGKPLARYFPDVAAALAALPETGVVLDGELVVPLGGALSFEALQLRLHPAASRVARLAAEAPALLVLFDLLAAADGTSLLGASLERRRAALVAYHGRLPRDAPLRLSPETRDRRVAERWLGRGGGALDGVVAKRLEAPYRPGERAMLKVKHMRTADCVVGGFQYARRGGTVELLLLGLYDGDGRLDFVGTTPVGSRPDAPELTRRLEALVEPPGFSGGGPKAETRWGRRADWLPLRPELVVEVRYDHVSGGRFRHPTRFLRWRPDKAPRQCRRDEIDRSTAPAPVVRRALAGPSD